MKAHPPFRPSPAVGPLQWPALPSTPERATTRKVAHMDVSHVEKDLVNVLFTEKQIQDRLGELAR